MDLSFRLKGNCIANWLPISVSSREMSEAPTALDWLLKFVFDVDREAAKSAMRVLARKEKTPGSVTDEEAVHAYFALRDRVTEDCQRCFRELPESNYLGIEGPDKKVCFFMRPAKTTIDEVRLMRRWDAIAPLFDAPNQNTAEGDFRDLVRANTAAGQRSAFVKLIKSARADQCDALTWHIPRGESSEEPSGAPQIPVFRVGELDIPCREFSDTAVAEGAPHTTSATSRDTSLLLCALRYGGSHVVAEFHAEPHEFEANAGLAAQLQCLRQAPRLVDALVLMGLYAHTDTEANLTDSGVHAAQMVSIMRGGKDNAERVERNAQNLLKCARHVCLERGMPGPRERAGRVSDVNDGSHSDSEGYDSDGGNASMLVKQVRTRLMHGTTLTSQELQAAREIRARLNNRAVEPCDVARN